MHWFWLSILDVVILGTYMALLKVPSHKGLSRHAMLIWSFLIPAILSLIFFYKYFPETDARLLLFSFVWAFTFSSATAIQMYALQYIDTSALYPITTTSSLVLVVLVGLALFNAPISIVQWVGVILVVITLFLFLYKKGRIQYTPYILSLALATLVLSAVNKIIVKFISTSYSVEAFQLYSYVFGFLLVVIFHRIFHKRKASVLEMSTTARWGMLLGVLSFLGGYMYYLAIDRGPFSLVIAIHSLYIIVTTCVAAYLFNEKVSKRRFLLIILAIVAIIIIRLG